MGATTVSGTAYLASTLGNIDVFVTGGIGGVHRGGEMSLDESADLAELAQTPMTVVCAGVKSILDIPRTLERLETLGIPVLGFETDEFPVRFRFRFRFCFGYPVLSLFILLLHICCFVCSDVWPATS